MLNNIIVRLIAYYAAWLLALSGIFRLFPQILHYVAKERERIFVGQGLEDGANAAVPMGDIQEGVARLVDPAHTVPVLVAMILAFGVTLPITWLYRWTQPRKKYSQSFVHTLLVIPITIALIVFLVKGSLALAFSLAGIVAAIRFRTSLEEPIDCVYMLMAIGIGLAAGTQLTTVAYLASLVFTILILGVWKSNYAALPTEITGWKIDSFEKLGKAPDGEDIPTKEAYNAQIEVHTTKVNAAKKATALILVPNTKRWQIADVVKNTDGTAIVVFDIWLKNSVTLTTFIQDIEESGKGYINNVKLTKQEAGKV